MNGVVIVDASLAVKWLVREEHSDEARAISRSWANQGVRTAAPYLMPVEVANALHRRVFRGELAADDAARLLENLLASGIELREHPGIHVTALEVASELAQGAVYDSHYLALAQKLDCDLWTADENFFRIARQAAPNIRWIGETAAPA